MVIGLEDEFSRFCSTVIEAVVETWNEGNALHSDCSPGLWPTAFSTCATDFERVVALLRLSAVRQFSVDPASQKPLSGLKSDTRSQELRESGNSAWRTNNVADAMRLYTKAIFYAKSDEHRALAFANRSCVLARLGADSAVLEDIALAFQYGYPVHRRSRLLVRRAESLLNLKQTKEAQNSLMEARQCVDPNENNAAALVKLIDQCLLKCNQASDNHLKSLCGPPLFARHPGSPCQPACVKPEIQAHEQPSRSTVRGVPEPKGSGLFEVCYGGDDNGWQVVATKPIKPGDLILVDKPYARRIHIDRVYSHCYLCFRRSINLRPCRGCSEVGFCSSACEEAAWTPDWSTRKSTISIQGRPCHRFECGQVHRIQLDDYAGWKWFRSQTASPCSSSSSGSASESVGRYCSLLQDLCPEDCVGSAKVSWLAFACVARTHPQIIKDLAQCPSLNTSSPLFAFSGIRRFPDSGIHSDNYSAVGWLVTNSEKRELSDLWQRTVAAVFLGHCLSFGGYPLDWGEDCLRDPTMDQAMSCSQLLPASWACACLLQHIQAVASNAHTFSIDAYFKDLTSDGVLLTDLTPSPVGSCLYPLLSLLNHSCNPNVSQVYMADGSCGLFALRAIRPNDALLSNYGYHYATHPLSERRQSLLEQYYFLCQCDACLSGWHGTNELINLRCLQCRKAIVLDSPANCSTPQGRICACSTSIQQKSVHEFSKLNEIFRELTVNIPADYLKRPYHKIPRKLLTKHISQVVSLLDVDAFEKVLIRRSMPFDYLQELLKILLDLRFGCSFMETNILNQP